MPYPTMDWIEDLTDAAIAEAELANPEPDSMQSIPDYSPPIIPINK